MDYTYANNTKAEIDNVFINKKWNNGALNCEAYSSFEGASSDLLIVTAKIRLSIRSPIGVRKNHADVKTASKCSSMKLTNINALKLKKVQNELANIYLKEQTEYIQNQID